MTRQSPGMGCIPGLEGDQSCGGGALPVVLVLRVSSHVSAEQRRVSLFVLEGSTLQQRGDMKRIWIRWLLLLVVVCLQTGCCWSHCPQPEKSAVEWHTPPYGHNEGS